MVERLWDCLGFEFNQACYYLRASTPSPLAVLRTTARAKWESQALCSPEYLAIMTGCSPGMCHFSGALAVGRMTHLIVSPRLIGVVLRRYVQEVSGRSVRRRSAESFSSASSFVPPTFCRSRAASYPKRSYGK